LAYDAFDRMTSVSQGRTSLQSMTYGPDGCPRHSGACFNLWTNGDGSARTRRELASDAEATRMRRLRPG